MRTHAQWPLILLIAILATLHVPASASEADTQLGAAVGSGDLAAIRSALDAGANIDVDTGEGRTPLIVAVIFSRPQAVQLLLERGADPNRAADDSTVGNALGAAFMAMNGVALLRNDEPDPDKHARAIEVLRLVAAKRPKCDIFLRRATSEFSPLMLAAQAGVVEAVKILLAAGANPNLENQGRYSALDFAVDRPPIWSQAAPAERQEVIRVLLAAGAKVQKKGADGLSPIERARRAGNSTAVALLSAGH